MAIIHQCERKKGKGKIAMIAIWTILLVGIPIVLFPLTWTILCAFKTSIEIQGYPPTFFPKNPTFEGFETVFRVAGMGKNFLNTAFCIIWILILQMGTSALAAYSLSKLKPKGGNFWQLFFMATMMLSSQALAFPLYLMMADFPVIHVSLLGSKWAYILASSAWAWSLMLFRGFFDNIPSDLIEAAYIDGASAMRTFVSICIPLAIPVFLLNTLNTFTAVYNDFFMPLMLIPTEANWTLMVKVYITERASNIPLNGIFVMLMIVTIPILVMYFIVQKHLVEGIATSGMKL